MMIVLFACLATDAAGTSVTVITATCRSNIPLNASEAMVVDLEVEAVEGKRPQKKSNKPNEFWNWKSKFEARGRAKGGQTWNLFGSSAIRPN